MAGLIDRLAPLITPQADVAGAYRSFADSIQRKNAEEDEKQLQREQLAAQMQQHKDTIAAENQRAQATIEAAKQRQQAEFGEKKREQQLGAVKAFQDAVLSGDPAAIDAAAPLLKLHGVELQHEKSDLQLPSAPQTQLQPGQQPAAMSAISPGALSMPQAPMAPVAPSSNTVKLKTAEGEDLGEIDLQHIGEARRAATQPALERLLAGASPMDRAAFQQQIQTAYQSPAMMALGVPKLIEAINKSATPLAAQQHADYRARVNAAAQREKVEPTQDLSRLRLRSQIRQSVVRDALREYNIPDLNKTIQASGKVEEMLKLHPELKTGAGDIEAMEGQIRATLGGSARVGPELLEQSMRRAGFSGEAERKLRYFIDGGKLPPDMIGDALKISQAMGEQMHRLKLHAAQRVKSTILSNTELPSLMSKDELDSLASSAAQEVGGLNEHDLKYLEAMGGEDAAP